MLRENLTQNQNGALAYEFEIAVPSLAKGWQSFFVEMTYTIEGRTLF